VTVIEIHASDVTIKNVFENPDRLSSLGVPNFDGFFSSNIDLESNMGEECTLDWIVI